MKPRSGIQTVLMCVAALAVFALTAGPAAAQLGGVTSTVTDTTSTVTNTLNNTTSTLTGGGTSTGGTSTGGSTTTTADNPPQVTVTAPGSGSTVSGFITVRANASDDRGIASVRFFVDAIDSAHLIKEEFQAPYEFSWNTANVPNGEHRIAAVARDTTGHQTTSAPVTFTVANGAITPGTTPPTVSITAPRSGDVVSGAITVSANASDNGFITSVRFFADGNLIKEELQAPYEFPWDTTAVSNGSHTLTAHARDDAGNVTISPPVTGNVANGTAAGDTTGPNVVVTAPAAGATVSGSTRGAANAADSGSGVAQVRFFLDGTSVIKDEFEFPYEFDWPSTSVADGTHRIHAVARDNAGNITSSAAVTFTVANGTGGGGTTPPPGGTTRFEVEAMPEIFSTGWVARGAEIATFSGGTAASSDVAGSTATFTFTGTAVAWIGLSAGPLAAGPALTVYSQDLGFVRETRTLELGGARDTVRLTDVGERPDFSSLRLVPTGDARVTRLAFRFDAASGDGVIERARGSRVRVASRGDRVAEGVLVAADANWLVVRADDGADVDDCAHHDDGALADFYLVANHGARFDAEHAGGGDGIGAVAGQGGLLDRQRDFRPVQQRIVTRRHQNCARMATHPGQFEAQGARRSDSFDHTDGNVFLFQQRSLLDVKFDKT